MNRIKELDELISSGRIKSYEYDWYTGDFYFVLVDPIEYIELKTVICDRAEPVGDIA